MADTSIQVTLTEVPQFRRIVAFVDAVEDYARVTADVDLSDLVDDLHADLRKMAGGSWKDEDE